MDIYSGKPVATSVPRGPSVAFFVDVDNTGMSPDNLTEIISILKTKGSLQLGKVYGYGDDKVQSFEEVITAYGLETVGKMRFKGTEASVVDTRLVVDCLKLTEQYKYSSVFVWAGMGDMLSLFSQLKAFGVRVLTIDNPKFDCNNRFVDEKIRLFSPYNAKVLETRPTPPKTTKPASAAQPQGKDVTLDGAVIPVLPRKAGAPEFGATNTSKTPAKPEPEVIQDQEDDNSEMTAEDNEELLNRLISFYSKYQEELTESEKQNKPEYLNDFGDLGNAPPKKENDDDYFSISPVSSTKPPSTPLATPSVSPPAYSTPPMTSNAADASSIASPVKFTPPPLVTPKPPPLPVPPPPILGKTIAITSVKPLSSFPKLKPLPYIPTKPSTITISAAPSSRPSSTPPSPPPSPFVAMDNKTVGETDDKYASGHLGGTGGLGGSANASPARPVKDFNYYDDNEKPMLEKPESHDSDDGFTSFDDPYKKPLSDA